MNRVNRDESVNMVNKRNIINIVNGVYRGNRIIICTMANWVNEWM